MPTPERLQTTLHLNHDEITLAPPLPNDHPNFAPTASWSGTNAGDTHEQYRILLTGFSSTYPLEPTSNGHVPMNQNILAWVVSTTPLTTNVPGCGGWGINAVDATTGHPILGASWEPGP